MEKRVFERLKKKVALWLLDDVKDSVTKQLFHDNPVAFFNSLDLSEDSSGIALIGLNLENLRHWHLVQYENALMNSGVADYGHLGLAAKYAKKVLDVNAALINSGFEKKIDCSVLLTDAPLTLALSIIAGWVGDARSVFLTVVAGLDTSLLDLRKNPRHQKGKLYRHFWFLLHLCSDHFAVDVTADSYSYPDNMSPYDEVLQHWKADDPVMVQRLVSSMADFHLAHSRSTGHGVVLEFDVESRALFPYEILAFLRIREWAGLKNPDAYDHPLMNIALAQMKEEPVPYPAPDFSETVIKALQHS